MPKKKIPETDSSDVVAILTEEFLSRRDPDQAVHLMRFFKTGPGQYGEGDRFLGIKVPVTRSLIKSWRDVATVRDCDVLLDSPWHEIRLASLLLLVYRAVMLGKRGDTASLLQCVKLYDRRLERANNWDLIDLSAWEIMGSYWKCAQSERGERKKILRKWAGSGNLWRQRAAMVSTYSTLRLGSFDETFWLAVYFIDHPHDLMHKASGWMLREAGKIDRDALRSFLSEYNTRLPRTTLRYAIEHMDGDERRRWMAK